MKVRADEASFLIAAVPLDRILRAVPACKPGCGALTSTLERIERGEGTEADVITLRRRALDVTDGRRCALPVGEPVLVQTALEEFTDEFLASGRPARAPGISRSRSSSITTPSGAASSTTSATA